MKKTLFIYAINFMSQRSYLQEPSQLSARANAAICHFVSIISVKMKNLLKGNGDR